MKNIVLKNNIASYESLFDPHKEYVSHYDLNDIPDSLNGVIELFEQTRVLAIMTKGLSKSVFFNNREKRSAIFYELIQLGEIVKKYDLPLKQSYPRVQWHKIVGLRNHLAHDTKKVNLHIVWNSIQKSLPKLGEFCVRKTIKIRILMVAIPSFVKLGGPLKSARISNNGYSISLQPNWFL